MKYLVLLLALLFPVQANAQALKGTVSRFGVITELNGGTGAGFYDGLTKTRNNRPVRVIAHRGYGMVYAQNTMYAYNRAIATKNSAHEVWMETDVQVTSDGYLVLFHDATLDDITDCSGAVSSKTLAEIQACSIDNPGVSVTRYAAADKKIPLFTDFLALMVNTKTKFMPEIKAYRTSADIATMVAAVSTAGATDLAYWICDSLADCTALRAASSTAPFAYLGSASTLANMQAEINSVAAYGGKVAYINSGANFASNPTAVTYAYGKGVDVEAYTAQSAANLSAWTALNITNIASDIFYDENQVAGLTSTEKWQTPGLNYLYGTVAANDSILRVRNFSTTGISGISYQNDVGDKYLAVGVNNSAMSLGANYGAAGEAVFRSSSGVLGNAFVAGNATGYHRFLSTSSGTELARIGTTGTMIGTTSMVSGARLSVNGAISATGGSENHAVCWKAGGLLGYCSATVAADGTCGTCN